MEIWVTQAALRASVNRSRGAGLIHYIQGISIFYRGFGVIFFPDKINKMSSIAFNGCIKSVYFQTETLDFCEKLTPLVRPHSGKLAEKILVILEAPSQLVESRTFPLIKSFRGAFAKHATLSFSLIWFPDRILLQRHFGVFGL